MAGGSGARYRARRQVLGQIETLLARAFFRWGIPSTETGLAAAIGITVTSVSSSLPYGARLMLASGISLICLSNAAMGLRLRRSRRGIAILVVPGVLLPLLACLLSAGLPAQATVALVVVALGLLDVPSTALGVRARHHGGHYSRVLRLTRLVLHGKGA